MIREEKYHCEIDGIAFLLGLGETDKRRDIGENPLNVLGLHVGNPIIAFRIRRKQLVKKKESHSSLNPRPVTIDLPPLIVTRLSKK